MDLDRSQLQYIPSEIKFTELQDVSPIDVNFSSD